MKSEIKKKTIAAQKVPPVVIPDKKNETTTFIFGVLAAYLIIGLFGVFRHEMWRDEIQTWLVGASSKNFGEFKHNMSYDTVLWFFINFLFSRFTDSPVIAQIFHFLVSAGSVFLILKYAPFSRLQKVLLVFSYYILFEYTLIARGYALTIFFTFLFCTCYQIKSKNRYLILSLILFFLANGTGAEAVVLSLSFLAIMVLDYYFSEDTSLRKRYTPMQLFIAAFVVLAGVYFALKCMSPPPNTDRSNTWYTSYDAQRLAISLRTFWMSFIPIPNMSTANFWNSNMLYQKGTSDFTFTILFFLSLITFISCFLFFSKKLFIAAFYLALTFGVLLFTYSNNVILALYAVRHYGFLFITLIVSAWLFPDFKKSKFTIPWLNNLRNTLNIDKYFPYLFTTLLVINSVAGAIAYSKNCTQPFSEIRQVGNYITSHHLDKLPETGFIDYAVSPISAFTKQPIYFPDRDTIGTFTTLSNLRFSFNLNVLLSRISNYVSHQHDSVLFISTGDYFGIGEGKVINNIQFTHLASFYGGIVADESYVLYIARTFDLNKELLDSNSYHNPSTIGAILSSGYDLFQQGKLDDAGKIFTMVEDKTHGIAVPHLHNYLGMLYSKKNMTTDAEKEFNTEIALNLQKEEAFFNLGMLYFQNKDYPNAIKSWDSTIHINPKNADALNNIGVSYLNYKGDNANAKIYFEKAVELNPNYTQGYYNILACAQNTNDEEAMIRYTRILLDKGASLNDIKAKGINISDELLKKVNAR